MMLTARVPRDTRRTFRGKLPAWAGLVFTSQTSYRQLSGVYVRIGDRAVLWTVNRKPPIEPIELGLRLRGQDGKTYVVLHMSYNSTYGAHYASLSLQDEESYLKRSRSQYS
jgi:hypothetical protein